MRSGSFDCVLLRPTWSSPQSAVIDLQRPKNLRRQWACGRSACRETSVLRVILLFLALLATCAHAADLAAVSEFLGTPPAVCKNPPNVRHIRLIERSRYGTISHLVFSSCGSQV